MKLRILAKIFIISLAIAIIGGTAMVWYAVSTKAGGEEDGWVRKAVAAGIQSKAGKNIIRNWEPANKDDTLFYVLSSGTELPYIRVEYAAESAPIPFNLEEFTLTEAFGYRRPFGNPPARAAPEPRGPL
ncbi:MAG: hypothetical protein GXZ07_01180 [Firmicutes bacterium]|nr:hypothetical protein [Bacillota bacterium]